MTAETPGDGSDIVFVFDPDRPRSPRAVLPCFRCGHPSRWFALGVSGCLYRCGARDDDHAGEALAAVQRYVDGLPALSLQRRTYAARHPAPGQQAPRLGNTRHDGSAGRRALGRGPA